MLIFARDADELEWYVPAAILPSDLQISLNLVNQFLETPLDLEGKKPTQLLSKKTRRRARRREPSSGPESEVDDEDQPKRKARKKKEEVQYKSAQFIEDSDAELGDDEEFFKKEAALRAKTALAAAEGINATMKPTGTKKRRKRNEAEGREKKKWKGGIAATVRPSANFIEEVNSGVSDADVPVNGKSRRRASASGSDQSVHPHSRPLESYDLAPEVVALQGRGEPHTAEEINTIQTHPKPTPIFGQSSPIEKQGGESDEEGGHRFQVSRRRNTKALFLSDEDE